MADTLIAYFSWGGKSAALASKLHNAIDGSDVYHIITQRRYSGSFFITVGQALREKKHDARPALKVQLSGKQMLKYDRVILIYPIWGGTCPMAVRTFLEGIRTDRLDIFPISLSHASGALQSVIDIKKSAPEAAVAEGLALKGRDADSYESFEKVMKYLGLW